MESASSMGRTTWVVTSSGVAPGRRIVDVDGGGVGAREEVDAEVAEREDPQDHQEADEHHREDGAPDAELGKTHGYFAASTGEPSRSSWPSGARRPGAFASRPATISTSSPLALAELDLLLVQFVVLRP